MANHIECGITPRMYPARRGRGARTLNIELQKRTPSRHRGNYYACGHRGPRTNNPELWAERGDKEREFKTYASPVLSSLGATIAKINLSGGFSTIQQRDI